MTSKGSACTAWGDGGTEPAARPLPVSLGYFPPSLCRKITEKHSLFPIFLRSQAAALSLSSLLEWLLLLLWLLRDPSPLSRAPAVHESGPELLRALSLLAAAPGLCTAREKVPHRRLCHLVPLMLEIVLISSLFPRHRAQKYFSCTEQTRC